VSVKAKNPAAFPLPAEVARSGRTIVDTQHGMTLRDYFAAQAIIGLISSQPADLSISAIINNAPLEAYAIADAMLKARMA